MDLFETGHLQVDADRDPDLRLHGVVAGPVERFNTEVLFNPFEEQLDAPTALVDGRDDQCCQGEIVGQESQRFAGLGIDEADTSEPLRVLPFALGHS